MGVKSPKLSVKFRTLGHFERYFFPVSPKRAQWVGGVRYLGQSHKKKIFSVPFPKQQYKIEGKVQKAEHIYLYT